MAKRNVTLHDKYKSTTALYPKIDASSFTPGAIEKVAEISKDEIEDNVVPNQTPTGTPTELQYITINGVEYYIKEGTLVIANPTLAGTEADLTGIQIGDIKYKIPSGGTQVQSNWNETDTNSPAYIQNKPNLATVATSGSYNDLIDKPSIIYNRELMISSSPVTGDNNLYVPVIEMQDVNNYIEISGYLYKTGANPQDRRRFTMRIKQTPFSGAGYVDKPEVFIDHVSGVLLGVRGYFYYNINNLRVQIDAIYSDNSASSDNTIVVEHIKEIINY